ncbi:hypothetical protein C0995_011141 [Termitomyces sp. Mi166|nr:hypothetical protein C0995_011141 [Termitomyces sp. Mi166\
MSHGTPNDSDLVNFRIVSEEEYRVNLKRAEEAQAQLDHFKAMNEEAKKAYDKQQELLRKVQEGKEAEFASHIFDMDVADHTPPGVNYRLLREPQDQGKPLALAGPSGQVNPPATHTQWWYPTANANAYTQQTYGMSYHTAQMGNQPSSSQNSRQYGDAPRFAEIPPAQQPQTSQPVHTQNYVQPQQNPTSRPSRTTTSSSARQQVSVQQGRQALPMQPVTSTLQSNQDKTVSRSPPVVSPNTSVQHGGQSRPHAQSGQGSAVPNFVISSGVQQYQTLPLYKSRFDGASDASKTTNASQPALPTAAPLPKFPSKQDETDLSATATRLQAQLNNNVPSQSIPEAGLRGSSQQIHSPADMTISWQRFSQSIVAWASTAIAPSEMPLANTKIRVVKDANSQVFVTIPGINGHNPITVTLQTLLATVRVDSLKAPTSQQGTTAGHLNKPDVPDFRNGYRPYSVPQHQPLQASASSGASGASTSPIETSQTSRPAATPAPLAPPSPPTKLSAAPPSSGRTPSQADKKSLAKDILRALSFPSLKRSQPDEPSVTQVSEPPPKRHASGPTPQTSSDVISQTSMKDIEHPPQTAATYPLQTASSGQASSTLVSSTSTYFRPPVSSTIPSESALPQTSDSDSHLTAAPATAPNTNQPHLSSLEMKPIGPTIQNIVRSTPSNDDDLASVSKNLFPERPKTPLFLPSPSSSPVAGPSGSIPETLLDLNHDVVRRVQRRTRSFYILVPPDPLWLQQHRAQQLRNKRQRVAVDVESEGESSNGGAMGGDGERRAEEGDVEDEDIDVIDLDPANDLATDEFEREAIFLSCSRIRERPCKWNSCSAVLNSTEKLIRHLAYAHQEIFEEFSICRWQRCGQHACAYQDCKETFRTPRQLVKHHQAEHSNDPPKPASTPFAPTLQTPPDASPPVLLSYLMEPVQRHSMTQERHGNLGPWVLRQIAGPVNHEFKRYNAASKLLQSPSRSDKQGYQPYDFLSFPSTNYSSTPSLPSKIRGVGDLISGEVSDMVHNGLVLWGPQKEDEDEDEDELLLPSSPLQLHPDVGTTTEEQLDINAVQNMLEN